MLCEFVPIIMVMILMNIIVEVAFAIYIYNGMQVMKESLLESSVLHILKMI